MACFTREKEPCLWGAGNVGAFRLFWGLLRIWLQVLSPLFLVTVKGRQPLTYWHIYRLEDCWQNPREASPTWSVTLRPHGHRHLQLANKGDTDFSSHVQCNPSPYSLLQYIFFLSLLFLFLLPYHYTFSCLECFAAVHALPMVVECTFILRQIYWTRP